jgi:hypothetical protein
VRRSEAKPSRAAVEAPFLRRSEAKPSRAAVEPLSLIPLAAPALPLDEAGRYVAGAYVVFVALLLIYVAIMAVRLARIDRELGELARLAERKRREDVRDEDREGIAVG